jgi:hypothetical protein
MPIPIAAYAIALVRSCGGKITGSTAMPIGVMTAAPIPISARAAMSVPVPPA